MNRLQESEQRRLRVKLARLGTEQMKGSEGGTGRAMSCN